MSPISLESVNVPQLEVPLPAPTPPAAQSRTADSFQDHLQRVGRSSDADKPADRPADRPSAAAAKSADKGSPETAGKAGDPKQPQETNANDHGEANAKDDSVVDSGGAKPVTAKNGEKKDAKDDDQKNPAENEAAGIAAAVAEQAQKAAAQTPGDEVTLSDGAQAVVGEDAKENKTAEKPAAIGVSATKVRLPGIEVPKPDSDSNAAVVTAAATVTGVVKAKVDQGVLKADQEAQAAQNAAKQAAAGAATGTAMGAAAATPVAAVEEATKDDGKKDDGSPKTKADERTLDGVAAKAEVALKVATAQLADASAGVVAQATTELTASTDAGTTGETRSDDKPKRDHHEAAQTLERGPSGGETPRAPARWEAASTNALGGEAGSSLSQADRTRLVQRVARAVQTAHDRGGDLSVRLSPPELGSLRLHVKLTDGALTARLEAETPQAKQVLTDNLPMLRERLAEQNIRIERFDVDLFQSGGGGPSNFPERRNDAPHDGGGRRGTAGIARSDGEGEVAGAEAAAGNRRGNGRLDIFI